MPRDGSNEIGRRRDMAEPRVPLDVARLVEEHHAAIYRYAYRLTGSVPDAEDLSQQVFLTAHEKIGQLRDDGSVRGWLFTILRSWFLKSRRQRLPVPAADSELELAYVPDVPPGEEIDRERLQSALDELPDEFKIVLVMFYFEHCSYRDIAEKLQVPPGTVMSRLSRAKGLLRKRLLLDEAHAGLDRDCRASE